MMTKKFLAVELRPHVFYFLLLFDQTGGRKKIFNAAAFFTNGANFNLEIMIDVRVRPFSLPYYLHVAQI